MMVSTKPNEKPLPFDDVADEQKHHKQKLVSEGERWNDMSVYKAKQTTSAAIITFRKKQKLYILYFSLNANLCSIENEGRTYRNENIKLKQNALECNSLFFSFCMSNRLTDT